MKSKFIPFLLTLRALNAHAEEPLMVQAELRLVAMKEPVFGHGYVQNKKYIPLVVTPDFLTDEIRYIGEPRFAIIPSPPPKPPRKTTTGNGNPDNNGKRPSSAIITQDDEPHGGTPIAWHDLPVTGKPQRLILLLTPGQPMQAINDEPSLFPLGSLRFINLCPYDVAIKIGEETTQIPTRTTKVVRPKTKEFTYYEGQILTYEDQEMRTGYALRVFQQNDTRWLYFITPGEPHSGQIHLKGVEDRIREKILPQPLTSKDKPK